MKRIVWLAVCAALLATGCSAVPGVKAPRALAAELPAKGDASAPADRRLVSGNTAFGFRLLSKMDGDDPNTLLSPFSVTSALAMTANAADGDARAAMERVLFDGGLTLADANPGYADLLSRLQTDTPSGKLTIANSLWLAKGEEISPGFLATDRDYYAAEATSVDFASLDANERIDAWVKARTRGLIPELYGKAPFPRETVMVLVNALYFKSEWKDAFDPERTREESFTASSGSFLVPMMHEDLTADYLGEKDFDAVRLPYKDGARSMYVFVPKSTDGLDAFLAKLDAKSWDGWMRSFERREDVIVGLPRMKLKTKVPLNDPLKALGMTPAFEGGFDGVTTTKHSGSLAITDVVHAVTVEVDEKGTKAAAATGVTVGATAMPVDEARVRADRPFFFAVRDDVSGVVLFAGAVRDPR